MPPSGSPRSRGPRPFAQHQVSTTFLRVPVGDWPAVRRGLKTEFRSAVGGNVTQLWNVKCPTPVVAYAKVGPNYDYVLMVLEETWREPLGAISEESLHREGFRGERATAYAHFRRYMMTRERRHFTPTREVQVHRVRPWRDEDTAELSAILFTRLYGEFLDGLR